MNKRARRKPKNRKPVTGPNRSLTDLANRIFGPAGATTRFEFWKKLRDLNRDCPELVAANRWILLRFYLHGRHNHIRFSSKPGAEGFLVKEGGEGKIPPRAKRIRGIHSLLRTIFYPNFDRAEHSRLALKYIKKKGKRAGEAPAIAVPLHSSIVPSGCDWSMVDTVARDGRGVGAELGKQVHKQLEIFARDQDVFARRFPRPDPLVAEVIRKITQEWRLVPLWSEYEIWDETLCYATSVDLVCFHPKKKRLVFLEIKTGYRGGTFTFSTGKKIRGRFGVDSTPLNHAILQLLIPIETMKRRYAIRAIDGYVIHVNEDAGVRAYKLPTNAQLPRDRLYNYVARRTVAEERDKKKKRKQATNSLGRDSAKRARVRRKGRKSASTRKT